MIYKINHRKHWLMLGVIGCFAAGRSFASLHPPISVQDRMKGSERIVVAKPTRVISRWETNQWGDKLIMSHFTMEVEDTLKGPSEKTFEMIMEGGTVDGISMGDSRYEPLKLGERAIFILEKKTDKTGKTVHSPHFQGLGILKLDSDNKVKNSTLRVDDIRQMAKDNP